MRVKAKHNVCIDGVWHLGGEEFLVDSIDGLHEHVEQVAFVSEIFKPVEEIEPPKKQRGRPKKTQ